MVHYFLRLVTYDHFSAQQPVGYPSLPMTPACNEGFLPCEQILGYMAM